MTMHDCERLPSGHEQTKSEVFPVPRLSLRQFMSEAGRVIRNNLSKEVWVEAIVLDVRVNRSGYALDLGEPHTNNPSTGAWLRCFMAAEVFECFREAAGGDIEVAALKGCCAMLRISPTFHLNRHLQASVLELKPTLAHAPLEQMMKEVRFQLLREDILHRQRKLPDPVDILRIGVVHPERSAGYADILPELEKLERSGIAASISFPATFEGPGAR